MSDIQERIVRICMLAEVVFPGSTTLVRREPGAKERTRSMSFGLIVKSFADDEWVAWVDGADSLRGCGTTADGAIESLEGALRIRAVDRRNAINNALGIPQ